MSRQPDGPYACDGCGGDIGNGGIASAMSLVDYHEDAQRHRHLCYRRMDAEGNSVPGCRDELLGGLP